MLMSARNIIGSVVRFRFIGKPRNHFPQNVKISIVETNIRML